jgi:DNA-binding PadR family transcriptional regulator
MFDEQIREFLKTGNWAGQHACLAGIWAFDDQGKQNDCCTSFSFGGAGGGSGKGGSGGSGGSGGPSGFGGFGGGFPPFPPFNKFPWNFFRRPRAKRGDVRAAILALLAEKPLNGYQIMQELEQRSRGSWRPSPGAVYPALQLLEDEGLVQVESSSGGRIYSLTEKGRVHVREHAPEFEAPWGNTNQPSCDDSVLGLFAELKHIAAATIQVVHNGSSNHIQEAQKILYQARRALYRLLADDAPEDTDE